MTLRLKDSDGNRYRWELYRDARRPAAWVLKDHTGYLRTLQDTYLLSLPTVLMVVANHGFTLEHELS